MSLRDFIQKHRQADAPIKNVFKNGIAELDTRLNTNGRHKPRHIASQKQYIKDLFDTEEPVWLFFFDSGRYDFFEQLYPEYLSGNLERVYNGGVSFTGDWAERHLTFDAGTRGLFSWVPIRGFADTSFDGTKWFEVAPDIHSECDTSEQLAALGYAEYSTENTYEISPEYVNAAVREYRTDLNGGVIRYLKPHPPFDGLEDLTSGATKTLETKEALESGEVTYEELTNAYEQTYRTAFEHAVELIPELDGRVVITSDHGTCLTCGQLFHRRAYEPHDHMTIMPWFEVDTVL